MTTIGEMTARLFLDVTTAALARVGILLTTAVGGGTIYFVDNGHEFEIDESGKLTVTNVSANDVAAVVRALRRA